MGFRRAAKSDGNQQEIMDTLRACGFDVDDVHQLKKLYDLVVTGHHRGIDMVISLRVEVKIPKAKLSPDEKIYWDGLKNRDKDDNPECLIIARCAEDVLKWFGHLD